MPRSRHRYIIAKILCRGPPREEAIERTARGCVQNLIGVLGAAQMKVRMIGFVKEERQVIFRCDLHSVEKLRAALALMTHIDGDPVAVLTVRCAGTIKALEVKLPRRRR